MEEKSYKIGRWNRWDGVGVPDLHPSTTVMTRTDLSSTKNPVVCSSVAWERVHSFLVVKEQPDEIWVNLYPSFRTYHSSLESAQNASYHNESFIKTVRYVLRWRRF